MEFKDNEAIYLQIAAIVSDNILLGKWPGEQKIPSVRDLAVDLEVNPNTVMRSYDFLQSQEVIYNKRGLGFFVSPQAQQKTKQYRKERFMQQDLPAFFKTMYLLDIEPEDITQHYERFKKKITDLNQEHKMKTSNKLLAAAILVMVLSIAYYDTEIVKVYRSGAYKKFYDQYSTLHFSNFDVIDLNASTYVNIKITQGPYLVRLSNGEAKAYTKITQNGNHLRIDANMVGRGNDKNDYVLLIRKPNLSQINLDARYTVSKKPQIDTTATEDGWYRKTQIVGFTLDSLTINQSFGSYVILAGNHINKLNATVGKGKDAGAYLDLSKDNQVKQANVSVLNRSTIIINNALMSATKYSVADSARVMVIGSAKK